MMRHGRVSVNRSRFRAALFWLSALFFTGCVRAVLAPVSEPTAPLPGARSVLFYNFVTADY
jgi:hypothetical protein